MTPFYFWVISSIILMGAMTVVFGRGRSPQTVGAWAIAMLGLYVLVDALGASLLATMGTGLTALLAWIGLVMSAKADATESVGVRKWAPVSLLLPAVVGVVLVSVVLDLRGLLFHAEASSVVNAEAFVVMSSEGMKPDHASIWVEWGFPVVIASWLLLSSLVGLAVWMGEED